MIMVVITTLEAKNMKTAFIGHRRIFAEDIYERLICTIQSEIENGSTCFTMGTHGEFDSLALSACKELRKKFEIEIEVVLTSLHILEKKNKQDFVPYSDVKTVFYEIENAHFKQQITLSNRLMMDTCDTLICYVNEKEKKSGAKTAMRYAKKQGLKIINLYREEDSPFYSMTKEQINHQLKILTEKSDIEEP